MPTLIKSIKSSNGKTSPKEMKICLFMPCYIDLVYPKVGIATLELLEKFGLNVDYPLNQTCCGQPMSNSGDQVNAEAAERLFVENFKGYDCVIGPAGSCVKQVRCHYDTLDQTDGTRRVHTIHDPHELADVDVGVVRAQFGVAETGAVWLTQEDLMVDALGFLSQHLVVLLDPEQIVADMHEAYARVHLDQTAYGCFMMGPSGTGDIEATLVHGAQGARSLNLFFLSSFEIGGNDAAVHRDH
jgi:hypothetical protein